MEWVWYVARQTELMLDIDTGKQGNMTLEATRAALAAAVDCDELQVDGTMFIYKSQTLGHYHVILVLRDEMNDCERAVWEMQLRSDLYRSRCNIMRSHREHGAPALLISPREWPGFYRAPDGRCNCHKKHTPDVMLRCKVARALRGLNAARGFFGQPKRNRRFPALTMTEGPFRVSDFIHSVELTDDREPG